MLPALDFVDCPNLAVPATVMRHLVEVESGANPFAIGVVGGRLVRQPRSLAEASATVRMLETAGYNYSVGVAQVNKANLQRYGLDTPEKAFDRCANLTAGAAILAACRSSAGGNWGKAFSCYYSGDFVTGFRHGYVQKIYDSISRGSSLTTQAPQASVVPPIPVQLLNDQGPKSATPVRVPSAPATSSAEPSSAESRIAMRVTPLLSADAARPVLNGAGIAVPASVRAAAPSHAKNLNAPILPAMEVQAGAAMAARDAASGVQRPQASVPLAASTQVFVPQVRSLGAVSASPLHGGASGSPSTPTSSARTDDEAFVF
ncbi:lytic transglycosylase domain-containing protein [Xenophilus arseniciresistens]|uniref:Lytic transglycosylase domain-containing protein n=1 Tax=Xenophilus arseniciresistens TaxID=1283306 RepID=A0AAE3T1X7_9BURK|nr:lytic transglycosylase domain-containing protein [Xenophilus arseniciresistens]MDA7418431.1 lytic transglycosylase domain-containing protein [Xenophilus arseniciresistens]